MRKVKRIVVHCSDSGDSQDIGRKEIDEWHKARGWHSIGYHWVIRRDGTIEQGRPEHMIGAHVSGHNLDTIGICLVGRKDFTAQLPALYGMLSGLLAKYKLDYSSIYGHYQLDPNKTCPNINIPQLILDLKAFQSRQVKSPS